MALYKDHYITIDIKRTPRIALQNIVDGETGNRFIISLTNDDIPVPIDGTGYRVCLRVKSKKGVFRQDSSVPDSGISFSDGDAVILLSSGSYADGLNRCRLEVYTTNAETDDTYICSAEFQFTADESDVATNVGEQYPLLAYYERLAKSYANGETGVRDGEDIDNAKYYKELAEQAVQGGIVDPTIDTWLEDHSSHIDGVITDEVDEWLDDHPEATTTVHDGAITSAKLADSAYHNTASVFDTTKVYFVGDYVIYSGNLYRFTAYKSAGSWDSTKVAAVALADDVGDLKSALINYNEFNLVDEYGLHNNSQHKGITWAWNGDECSVSGTATDGSFLSLINRNTAMPSYLVPGKSYWIIYNATDSGIKIEVLIYKNGSYFSTERFGETTKYTIPEDAGGIIIRLYVANGTTVNGSIRPIVLNAPTTEIIDERLNGLECSALKKSEYENDQRANDYNTKIGNPILLNDASLDKNISVEVEDGTSFRWNGKNLFKINPEQASFTKNGVTFTFNKDEGRISVASSGATGTAVSTQSTDTLNGKANMNINFKFAFPTDTVITISSNASQFRDYNAKWYLQITDGTTGYFEDGNGLTMTALAGVEYGIRVVVQSGFSTSERLDIYPQLEINDHKTEFEPYVGGIINDLTEDGEENIFEISHDVTATSNNVSWVLNKSKDSVSISSNGATNDTTVYDTSLALSHGSYNLWHFTPTEDTAVFLTGVDRAGLRLQISDGSIIWTDYGKGVGLVAKANTEYFVRLIVNSGFVGTAVIFPKVATGLSGLHGLETTVLYAAEGEITATYEQRPMYDCAYVSKDITKSIMDITGDKILTPFKSFKPIVTFIDDDTSTLTDVNNYASVFTSLGKVGTYAVMTRNLENSSELKQRLLDLETSGFGMVFHCEYQEGAETNYFLNDSNRDMELVRENITLGLRQMETYGFQNYRHWVTPYGVNDKDIVDVAKDYGLESIISMSNNSWVANTGNVSRYNIPRYSVSTSTPSEFPAIKMAANECKKANGWLLIVTHANTWRHNNVVPEMQALLTSVINYLTGIGFEVIPFARAYESRKGMFYFNELF